MNLIQFWWFTVAAGCLGRGLSVEKHFNSWILGLVILLVDGVLHIERKRARKRFGLHVQSFPNEPRHIIYIKKIPRQRVAGRRGQKVMGINGEKKPHVKCNAAKANKQTNKNHTAAHSRWAIKQRRSNRSRVPVDLWA